VLITIGTTGFVGITDALVVRPVCRAVEVRLKPLFRSDTIVRDRTLGSLMRSVEETQTARWVILPDLYRSEAS